MPQVQALYFFRVWVVPGAPIDRLELEAAAVADTIFRPMLVAAGVSDEISLVDNNVPSPGLWRAFWHSAVAQSVMPALRG